MQHPIRTSLIIAAGVLAVSNGHAQQMEGWPDWLKAAMLQENADLEYQEISVEDDAYSFKIAGKPSDPVAHDGVWYIATDIGSGSPLECYLYKVDSDLAALTNNLADININAVGENNGGNIANRGIFALDAGHIDGSPYLAMQWVYNVGEAPNVLFAMTTVYAARNDNITQACTNNSIGYRDTTREAFKTLVRSTTQPEVSAAPYYEEIAVRKQGDIPLGIAHSIYTLDADGDTQIYMTSASLQPDPTGNITANDETTISWSTPDGFLISSSTATGVNGEVTSNLELLRDEENNWAVNGNFRGTAINQTLDGTAMPVSELGQMQAARELFAGEETETSFEVWVPGMDPSRFQSSKIIRADGESALRGTLRMGPLSFQSVFSAAGSLETARMNLGPADLLIERVWSRGSPR